MNQERRLRELARRLAAMSPQAPPYPEETTMSSPSSGSSRPFSPMLVFAGAALVVLLGLGIPLLLMNRGTPPLAGDTTTTTLATTTTPPSVSSTDATTSTVVPTVAGELTVFLTQTPENSYLNNPALVAFSVEGEFQGEPADTDLVREAINLLGRPGLVEGYATSVPEGVEALKVRRAEGADNALIIEMNQAFLQGAGGLLGDFTMLNQLIYTATQIDGIEEVQFIVDNQQVTEFGTDGLDLSSSVNRESFQEHLALIYITEPIARNEDGSVSVVGIANAFEASVSLRVLDMAGEIVHEEFTSATCGSGCWGEFSFSLDAASVPEGSSIQVLEYSAQDGSPVNVVTVPVGFTGTP